MKRAISTVLALAMVLALVPLIGEPVAKAASGPEIKIIQQPTKRFYLKGEILTLAPGIEVHYYEYDNSGNTVVDVDVTSSLSAYKLNDTSPAREVYDTVTAIDKKTGLLTLTATYPHAPGKTYTATTTIRMAEDMVTGISLASYPNKKEYFVGETLDLTGLSYVVDHKSYTGLTSQETVPLTSFTLKKTNSAGEALSSSGPWPRLENADTPTYTIWAGYPVPDQWDTFTTAIGLDVWTAPPAISVGLSLPTISVPNTAIGTTQTLTATVGGSSVTSVSDPKNVTWGSDNPAVATVNSAGVVTFVGVGTANITVRTRGDNQATATCVVTVTAPAVTLTDIRLDKTQLTMTTGSQDKLLLSLVPANATPPATITWSVVPPTGVVDLIPSSDGYSCTIKAKGPGTATITATAGGFTTICLVTVYDVPVDTVYISPTSLTLSEGQAYQLTGTALPYDATDPTLTWTTSDPALAKVKDGRVTIADISDSDWTNITKPNGAGKWTAADVAAGRCTATVKITCASFSTPSATKGECTITIKQGIVVTQLSLNKYSASVAVGGTAQVIATVLPTNATTQTVTWRSSDPTIATVSSTGKITGIKPGQCKIIVTSDGSGPADLSKECLVTVSSVASGSIGLNTLNLTLYRGQTSTLVATVLPSNATNKDVTFTSTNPGVATVDASSGLITAITNGKTTIVVTANDGSAAAATCMVSVIDQVNVSSIKINMNDFALLHMDTTVLSATVIPDYASETDVVWSSSAPNIVSVDQNGKVSGLIPGQSAVITATAKDSSGASASITIDVVSTFYGTGQVVNCAKRVNVRALPSGQSAHKGFANLGAKYQVISKTGSWYKIWYHGQQCYIWSAYIRLLGDGSKGYVSSGSANTGGGGGTTTSPGTPTTCTVTNCVYAVNVRSGPGTTHSKVGTAMLNSTYKYLGTYGDWYKLQFNATTEGYIHMNYIRLG